MSKKLQIFKLMISYFQIVIVEDGFSVSILIATTASVHRIICPHPTMEQTEFNMGTIRTNMPSILE